MWCKLCKTTVDERHLYKIEGQIHIYRCPGCSKPVLINMQGGENAPS